MASYSQQLPGWNLVWADEFTQADGSAPDPAKWGYDIGRGSNGWGNAELQYYTNSRDNSRIENNELVIEVREETNFLNSGANYTSARLLTQGLAEFQYGRIEARIRVPSGQGLWPAFWTLGNDFPTTPWPFCGEIDIMEFVGREPNEIFGTIHGPGYSGGASFSGIQTFVDEVSDDYHVFVIEWEEDLIRWYVDGVQYHEAEPSDVAPNSWEFNSRPFFLILNCAVGGNFGQAVDPNLTFPRQMNVDYVRVYTPASSGNQLNNEGFELGNLTSWTPYTTNAGQVNDPGGFVESTSNTYFNGGSGGGDNVLTHSGTYTLKTFGEFSGGENYSGVYQEVQATAGTTWQSGGFALTHPQDLMVGTNTAWLEVSFRDDSDNVLGLYRSEVLTAAAVTAGSWMTLLVNQEIDLNDFSVLGTVSELAAPAGTTKARVQTVFRQMAGFDSGSVYWDDLSLEPLVVVEIDPCLEMGSMVSWNPLTESSCYQLQESTDNLTWTDVGSAYSGTAVSSYFAAEPSPFYQVIETTVGSFGNGVSNPSFETTEAGGHPSTGAVDWRIAVPEDTDPTDGTASMTVETMYLGTVPRTGSRMLVFDSSTPPAPASVNAPATDVRSAYISVDENTAYDLTFYAAHVLTTGGANPQVNVAYYSSSQAFIGAAGWSSFSGVGSSWEQVTKSFTTPAGTAYVEVAWIHALGAGNDGNWVTLIDDVVINTNNLPGSEIPLTATQADAFELTWSTAFGEDYEVTSGDDLSGFETVETTVTGDGNRATFSALVNGETRRFFRIEEVSN
ncbi:MAG: glycoside hydrolase family 16 protein [Verrucomicrobiota bacterium]